MSFESSKCSTLIKNVGKRMVFHFITIPYTEIYVQFYKSIMNNNLHIFHKTEMDFFLQFGLRMQPEWQIVLLQISEDDDDKMIYKFFADHQIMLRERTIPLSIFRRPYLLLALDEQIRGCINSIAFKQETVTLQYIIHSRFESV